VSEIVRRPASRDEGEPTGDDPGWPELERALGVIVVTATASVRDAAAVGITVLSEGRFITVAPTSDLPGAVDALQYRFGGPCLEAILGHSLVQVGDLRDEPRWPAFAAAVLDATPVRSMLCIRICIEHNEPLGSLNLYATSAHAFDDAAVRDGRQHAAQAALTLAASGPPQPA
jgi:hypothetical protein